MNQTINYAVTIALTIDDIKKVTVYDPVLSTAIEIIKNERWYELDTLPQGQETNELKQYLKIKDSVSLNDDQIIILKDNRIVIPRCFEIIGVKLARIGYQGLVKTKSLLFLTWARWQQNNWPFVFLVSQSIRNQNHRQ